jgi:hypothetical protein
MNKLLIPNTTQIPNVVLDDLMPQLSGSELKVLLAIVRKTYGWQKRSDKISFTTLRQLTGLSRDAVRGHQSPDTDSFNNNAGKEGSSDVRGDKRIRPKL